MERFSYSWQYAESEIDEVDAKGGASPQEILASFDAFDWGAQVQAANQLQRCSPTLSVSEVETDREFWVSAAGEPAQFVFVNQYTYNGETRRLFGLLRSVGPICPPSRDLSLGEARRGLELFLAGDHDALISLLA